MESKKKWTLEVCVDSVSSALEAQKGGADRVELCSSLIIGGTTPDAELFRQIRMYTDLPIRVLLRPRFGDFCYDTYEFERMKEQVKLFCQMGADGIVTGILTPDGALDVPRMEELIALAGNTPVALHRAFDMCRDPLETLEQAADLGICTILTSGQQNSAWEGRALIHQLVEKSQGRIEILAGAGITPEIIQKLIFETGTMSYHMSGKRTVESQMTYRREGVSMGLPGFSEYEIWRSDADLIQCAVKVLTGK